MAKNDGEVGVPLSLVSYSNPNCAVCGGAVPYDSRMHHRGDAVHVHCHPNNARPGWIA